MRNYRRWLILLALIPLSASGYDYSGDGTADIGIFRPRTGMWAIRGLTRFYHGAPGDRAVPGDYGGDGTVEAGIFRPPTRLWSPRGGDRIYLGRTGDEAATGDFSGDGTTEIGIFRPRTGMWAIRGLTRFYFGRYGDIPVPADYTGDGKLDPAIFRRSGGLWAVRGFTRVYFGAEDDLPVPGDYRGEDRALPAVYRPRSGLWAVRGTTRAYFGGAADIPVPADYNGDGTVALGLYRPSSGLWAIRGLTRVYFGTEYDLPVSARSSWPLPPLPALGIEVRQSEFVPEYLSKVAEAGSRISRFGFLSWRDVQPSSGIPQDYDWSRYDEPLAAAAEHGQTLMVIIGGVPSWAGEAIGGPIYQEALPAFADFLYAAVRRYSRPPYNVRYWELFNEPDGTRFWWGAISTWGLRGDKYAEMLRWAYPAIKAADPEALVLFGGLAYDNCIDPAYPDDEWREFDCGFLDDVLAHGGGDYFDYLNFHYYHMAAPRWGSIRGKADELRSILTAHGYSKPIVCSETGHKGYDDPGVLERQARFVPVVYAQGLAAGLESIVWFPLTSHPESALDLGLLWEDFNPKPAYQAYRTMTEQLTGYRYVGPVSREGIEGYAFRPERGGREKQVVWTDFEAEDDSREMDFSAARITVTDKFGEATEIEDGGPGDLDGQVNGRIRILAGPSPVYVELQ